MSTKGHYNNPIMPRNVSQQQPNHRDNQQFHELPSVRPVNAVLPMDLAGDAGIADRKIGWGERVTRIGGAIGTAVFGAAGGTAMVNHDATQPFIGPVLQQPAPDFKTLAIKLNLTDFTLGDAPAPVKGSRTADVILLPNPTEEECDLGRLAGVSKSMLLDGPGIAFQVGQILVEAGLNIETVKFDMEALAQASVSADAAKHGKLPCDEGASAQIIKLHVTAATPEDAAQVNSVLAAHRSAGNLAPFLGGR